MIRKTASTRTQLRGKAVPPKEPRIEQPEPLEDSGFPARGIILCILAGAALWVALIVLILKLWPVA